VIPVDVPHHSWAEQTRLLAILNRLAPDLVHFVMPQQPLLYRGAVVTTFHDLTILRIANPRRGRLAGAAKRLVGRAAFAIAARKSRAIIAPSRFTRDDLVRTLGIAPARVEVIYEAAEARPGHLEPVAGVDAPFLLYVGRQPAYKNVKALVAVHQRLLVRDPALLLVLVGRIDADIEETRRHCRETGARNVIFTGFLPDAQRDWLYARAAAYVFPSFMEGFGLPGLEAMGYGAPVVSSDATCLPEIYADAAAYFEPADEAAMERAIAGVLDDRDERERLIRRGRERHAEFSWRRMAEETLALYHRAVARP
jgi:glycosyltransferase involved in cell wall biosynthesis